VFWFPPFWFLGIYQRLLEGPAALPIYTKLAEVGCGATAMATLLTLVNYPTAYLRKVRGLIEGAGARSMRGRLAFPFERILNATLLGRGTPRAVFHFISRTILRVPRYRIYLVLYGGVGVSLLAAGLLRFTVSHHHVSFVISADGIRAAAGIVAFWTVAGLRMAFVAEGNQRGSWVFHVVHGKPAHFAAAMDELFAQKRWALLASVATTLGTRAFLQTIAPLELVTGPALLAQFLVASGLCLLLAGIAFTGEASRRHSNLALSVLKYYAFFPVVAALPGICEPWIEESWRHFAIAFGVIASLHALLTAWHGRLVREHCSQPGSEDDEDDLPMKLGLR
jgi:hypothetical protein